MTGIALILSINYISHDSKVSKKIIYAGYLIFSLYCVWLSNCSNAYLGLIVVICAYLLLKVVHIIDKKQLVVICLICCCLVTGILYGFLSSQQENAEFTDFETQLNTYSSSRYAIWKDSYYSHKENMLFGVGNIKLEKQERYQYMLDKGIDEGYDINSSMEQMAGTHNGYVGMISCTGILGLLFFVLGLWRKIIHAEILNDGFWYLAVIFILMLNLFECMFVLSFNFSCLMLFIVLALNNNCADHNKQPQSEVSK